MSPFIRNQECPLSSDKKVIGEDPSEDSFLQFMT